MDLLSFDSIYSFILLYFILMVLLLNFINMDHYFMVLIFCFIQAISFLSMVFILLPFSPFLL